MHPVWYQDLGTIDYQSAWTYQEELLRLNISRKSASYPTSTIGGPPDTEAPVTENYLLLLEHPPVYTLGKSGKAEHILINQAEMERLGIQYFNTNRGGDITFHGPGQLVGYPVLDLEYFGRDIGKYLRNLEEVIIRTIGEYGIKGERSAGETGVWIDAAIPGRERKICAMGVRCSRWITMHGFALNVNTDLGYFDHIIPCGIQHKQVTSIQQELGRVVAMEDIKETVKHNFESVFGAALQPLSLK